MLFYYVLYFFSSLNTNPYFLITFIEKLYILSKNFKSPSKNSVSLDILNFEQKL